MHRPLGVVCAPPFSVLDTGSIHSSPQAQGGATPLPPEAHSQAGIALGVEQHALVPDGTASPSDASDPRCHCIGDHPNNGVCPNDHICPLVSTLHSLDSKRGSPIHSGP